MTRRTPGFTPAGSGRAGAKRSAGKRSASALKRLASLPSGLTRKERAALLLGKSCLRKLARRGGVLRIADDCFCVKKGMPRALLDFLERVVKKAVVMAEYGRRGTIIPNDIAYALKQLGIKLYKEGLDWNYGFFSHSHVRKRIVVEVTQQQLEEAAASRAQSQVGSAATGGAEQQAVAGAAAARAEAEAGSAEVAMEEAEAGAGAGQQLAAAAVAGPLLAQFEAVAAEEAAEAEAEAAPVSSAAGSAAAGASQAEAAAAATLAEGEQAATAAAGGEQAQQQQHEVAVGEQAVAAKGTEQSPAAAAPAPGERRLSVPGVPTPTVMTAARCQEVMEWMSKLMHGPLSEQGWVSRKDLTKVMVAKHGCAAAEVQDVLFVLEKKERIQLDGDDIFLCD